MTQIPPTGSDSLPNEPSKSAPVHPDHPDHPQHHIPLPAEFEALGEDLRNEAPLKSSMIADAIGGWRGIIDSSLPALVFLLVYLTTDHALQLAIWAAVAAGALIAVWRLFRRQSLKQIAGGFFGVAISAFIASKTGNAANFFLPGLLINLAYGLAFAVSAVVRWPLIGVLIGAATGDMTGWRNDAQLRRAYSVATWSWAGMFALRSVVQVPLYFLGLVGPLGMAKIAMGWPLMLLVGWWTYRLVKGPLAEYRHRAAAAATTESAH